MAGRVEGGDHDVLSCDRLQAEGASRLVDEGEGRHRNELAGELAEAEVHVVVAGVDGAGDEPSPIDAEQQRRHAAGGDVDRDGVCVIAKPHMVVHADRQRARDQLRLVGCGGHAAGDAPDGDP